MERFAAGIDKQRPWAQGLDWKDMAGVGVTCLARAVLTGLGAKKI
jgi:hypothetical protein